MYLFFYTLISDSILPEELTKDFRLFSYVGFSQIVIT